MAQIDFSPIGDLFNTYRQAQMQSARQNSPLLAPYGGDMGLAALAMRKQEDERDFAARRGDVAFNQGIQQRQTNLAEKSAQDAARGFDYREIDDGQGGKKLVRIEKATGAISAPPIEGIQSAPNNPFMTGGKLNEAQAKDALYASRMLASEKVLRSIDADVATSWTEKARGVASDKLGYNLRSPEFQKFDQAQRDFINATLRRESGAVISDAEFDNARKQYFPQPGDTADVIKQKRLNRMEAVKGIGAGAGHGWRPDTTFDAQGELVPNPSAQPKAAALPRVGTPAEAAKLPKGTRFLDPNGVERIVP